MPSTRKKWSVLVFPGGTEVGLEIWRSLKDCKEINLYSVSSAVKNHAPFVFERHFEISDVRDSGWIDQLNAIISANQIDLLFPANSFVIDGLLKNRAAVKCPIVWSKPELIELTRSKRETLRRLSGVLQTPRLYESPKQVDAYPVFVKPDRGYGAQGAREVRSKIELEEIWSADPGLLIQEYLPGDEFTVDCFSSESGKLLYCAGRKRERVRMGTSMHAEIIEGPAAARFENLARRILENIPLSGAWFFQLKENANGELCLLEVEARIAGTMCLNRVRGVNFALLSIFQKLGIPIDILTNPQPVTLDRALVNRYRLHLEYEYVYVDLDDTLIVHGRINTQLVQFLYQCVNESKKIILISKNLEKDQEAYLEKFRLSRLFDRKIWLREEDQKSDAITEKNAIFIDDSFSQRKEVADKHGIPTFSPWMMEVLINERA